MIKKRRYFDCKKRGYIIYDCFRKRKFVVILKNLVENNSSQKKVTFFKIEKKSFFILSSFILKDLFYQSYFMIQYILQNKIHVITLINTYAIGYGFINKKFVEIVCKTLEIKFQHPTKSKLI